MPRAGVRLGLVCGAAVCAACAFPALAQPGPDGIDWVTIRAAGNAPWAGDGTPGDRAVGRGSVPYEYRIGRTEITTAQWAEFLSAAFARSDTIPYMDAPGRWGGTLDSSYPGPGFRFKAVPGRENWAVGGISWRTAAVFCNWLHNNKSSERSAFLSGAYDVSTFGYNNGVFTDQLARSPGARYFMPTWDEWLKAAHYDPNKQNADGTLGGWWTYSNGTDSPHVGAPPDLGGTANFGWDNQTYPGRNPFAIPLGAYASVAHSPWGLLDVAGETIEWTESVWTDSVGIRYRFADGSSWNGSPGSFTADLIGVSGQLYPDESSLIHGIRIASAVPAAPSVVGILAGATAGMLMRRRKCHVQSPRLEPRPSVWLRCPRLGDREVQDRRER